jgi:hypothetical protein
LPFPLLFIYFADRSSPASTFGDPQAQRVYAWLLLDDHPARILKREKDDGTKEFFVEAREGQKLQIWWVDRRTKSAPTFGVRVYLDGTECVPRSWHVDLDPSLTLSFFFPQRRINPNRAAILSVQMPTSPRLPLLLSQPHSASRRPSLLRPCSAGSRGKLDGTQWILREVRWRSRHRILAYPHSRRARRWDAAVWGRK